MDDPEVGETLTAEEPGGFTQVPDSLLHNTAISDGAYRLYALLKSHTRGSTPAFPGRRKLAAEMGVKSLRTIDARVSELRAAGYLKVTPRWRPAGGQSSNHYHLLFYPRPAPAPGAAEAPGPDQDDSTSTGGVQNFAGRNDLHPGDATDCAGSVQPAAGERSTSSPSTSTRTTPGGPPRRGPAGAARRPATGRGGGSIKEPRRPSRAVAVEPTPVATEGPLDPIAGDASERAAGLAWANAVVEHLPAQLYPATRAQFEQMTELLVGYTTHHRTDPELLAQQLVTSRPLPEMISRSVGLLRARLDQLAPPRPAKPAGPTWCGQCEERTRLAWDEESDVVSRCPNCHPAAQRQGRR